MYRSGACIGQPAGTVLLDASVPPRASKRTEPRQIPLEAFSEPDVEESKHGLDLFPRI